MTYVPTGTDLEGQHHAEATVFLSEFKDAELKQHKVHIKRIDIASAFSATVTLR